MSWPHVSPRDPVTLGERMEGWPEWSCRCGATYRCPPSFTDDEAPVLARCYDCLALPAGKRVDIRKPLPF